MIMPKYASRFSCIGGDCEDTCCAGWRVDLDRESFLHYQATFDPVLRPLVTRHLRRNEASRTGKAFGHIEMRDTPCRECGFLGEDRLCLIQKHLGEPALSDTCASFPRDLRVVSGTRQMTLSLACPEAARLALLAEDAFDLVEDDKEISQDWVRGIPGAVGVAPDLVNEVRISLYQVLRTVELPVQERLAILGLLCEGMTDHLRGGRPAAIPPLLQAIDQLIEGGTRFAPAGEGQERLDHQAKVGGLFFFLKQSASHAPRHENLVKALASRLGLSEDGSIDEGKLVQGYEEGLRRLRASPLATQALDRYLLNEGLREVFPWGEKTPLEHFATLLLRFSILRLMLVGQALDPVDSLSEARVVEVVQVFSRLYSHTVNFLGTVHRALGKDLTARLDSLYLLL
jgi:lysine-N-methylase